MLSGLKIIEEMHKENIVIMPYSSNQLNPNSYDVTLNNKLLVYKNNFLDVRKDNPTEEIIIPEDGYILEPGVLYLGSTNEYTETRCYVPGIEGKSSLARLGIEVHKTAGFGDINFCGHWTLEIECTHRVMIYPNMRIAQLYYDEITGGYQGYNGKYQDNKGVESSKSWKEN